MRGGVLAAAAGRGAETSQNQKMAENCEGDGFWGNHFDFGVSYWFAVIFGEGDGFSPRRGGFATTL